MLAMTRAPIDPPMVRMLAFIPLATPVWPGGTAWTMRLDMAEKARPKPDAEQGAGQVDLPAPGHGRRPGSTKATHETSIR